MKRRPDAVLIAGPTGSGKSALAVRLAGSVDGLIINADSMQVYSDLRIVTARPTAADEATIDHALFGTVDGAENYSVRRWLDDAAACLRLACKTSRMPIFVGGTGLYFKALTQGLSDVPPVPPSVRDDVRRWADGRSAQDLHAALGLRDPAAAARLRSTDPQRIIRALEVHQATGRSLTTFQVKRERPILEPSRYVAIYLAPDRAALRVRLNERFDVMMAAGALEEVARLAGRRLSSTLPVMRAHGVPPLLRHLGGELELERAVAQAKADTNRYVRRQDTFARHQLPAFTWVQPDEAEGLLRRELQL